MKKYIKHKGRPTPCQLVVGEPEKAGSGEREGGDRAGKQEARMVGFYSTVYASVYCKEDRVEPI